MIEIIINYVSIFIALMIVLPFHEFAHSFAAVKSGDITPKLYGRYTLNPFAHFDILGLCCFVFVGFGWAKPVPVNSSNFKNYKKGCFFVSIAGVAMNYFLAFFSLPLFYLSVNYLPSFGYFTTVINSALYYIFYLSLVFFVFNLIPVYPLDGFRIIEVFCKRQGNFYRILRYYGTYVLYGLFFLSILARYTGFSYFNFLGIFIDFFVSIIKVPITAFWGLIF